MYRVKSWDTREILETFEDLTAAKKYARGLGHSGEDPANLTGYPPLAYVVNDADELVYNPRFKKVVKNGAS